MKNKVKIIIKINLRLKNIQDETKKEKRKKKEPPL